MTFKDYRNICLYMYRMARQDLKSIFQEGRPWDIHGNPVSETPGSQCKGPGFDLWSGNWIPYSCN